jgi:GNAT superfamily N-acetyltransferase
MFRDMGSAPPETLDALRAGTELTLANFFARGVYVGWLAAPANDPERVVAGVGVQRRVVQPFVIKRADGSPVVTQGRQALVVNVYTEQEYRRRGLARTLMLELMTWASTAGVDALILHAAPDGRPLYESLGFRQTNEMRFPGDIAEWHAPVA